MMLSNPLPQQNSRRDDPGETAEFQWGILGLLASLPFGTDHLGRDHNSKHGDLLLSPSQGLEFFKYNPLIPN